MAEKDYGSMFGAGSKRVRFERPDYGSVKESGLLCADMHFHTHYSDSYTGISAALALAKQRNVGLAVTDHNLIGGALEAYELAKDGGPFIVPGIEISSWDGPHILVYFYDISEMKEYWENNVKPYLGRCPWLAMDKGTEWILDSLEDVNCVVSAAHPLGYLTAVKGLQKAIDHGRLTPEVAERFDAYEVICSGMFRKENIKARKKAEEFGLGFTGGSDGHLKSELGSVLTFSEATDLDGFLDDVKKHRTAVVGKEKNIPKKIAMAMACLSRFAASYPFASAVGDIERIVYHGTKNRPE